MQAAVSRVYILLTRSRTWLSRAVHAMTGDAYTHVSLAFDERLASLCSFSRKVSFLPLPSGLMQERLDGGYFGAHPDIRCALYALPVTPEAFAAAQARVQQMMRQRRCYRYSVRGLILCRLGVARTWPGYYFCSQFVAEVLEASGALVLQKPPALMRPQDFAALPGMELRFCGEMGELCRALAPGYMGVVAGAHK